MAMSKMFCCCYVVPAAKLEDDDPLHVSSGEFGRNAAIVGNRIDISGFGGSESSDDEDEDESLSARQRLKAAKKKHSEKKENLR